MNASDIGTSLASAAGVASAVAALRLLPVLVVIGASVERGIWRFFSCCPYLLLFSYAAALEHLKLATILAAYGYAALAALVGYALRARLGNWRLTLVFFLLVFVAGSLLVPVASAYVVVMLAWETALALYSYLTDCKDKFCLFDCLFFLFVDPTLVYTRRGKRLAVSRFDPKGLARLLLGLVTLAASALLMQLELSLGFDALARMLSLYFAHTGLAGIRIGAVQQVGLVVPEQYVAPYAARSPRDFWRRWNTYMGGWAERYLYLPVTRWLLRHRIPWLQRRVSGGIGAVFAFFGVGVLHDIYASATRAEVHTGWIALFLLNAAVVVAWSGAADLASSRRKASPAVRSGVSRAVLWSLAIVTVELVP